MKVSHSVVVSWENVNGTQSRYLVDNVPNVPLVCFIAAIATSVGSMCKHHTDMAFLQVTWLKQCEIKSAKTTSDLAAHGNVMQHLWRTYAAARRVM